LLGAARDPEEGSRLEDIQAGASASTMASKIRSMAAPDTKRRFRLYSTW
jgi:hypothetical protein